MQITVVCSLGIKTDSWYYCITVFLEHRCKHETKTGCKLNYIIGSVRQINILMAIPCSWKIVSSASAALSSQSEIS